MNDNKLGNSDARERQQNLRNKVNREVGEKGKGKPVNKEKKQRIIRQMAVCSFSDNEEFWGNGPNSILFHCFVEHKPTYNVD
jgi:hypothetical protein